MLSYAKRACNWNCSCKCKCKRSCYCNCSCKCKCHCNCYCNCSCKSHQQGSVVIVAQKPIRQFLIYRAHADHDSQCTTRCLSTDIHSSEMWRTAIWQPVTGVSKQRSGFVSFFLRVQEKNLDVSTLVSKIRKPIAQWRRVPSQTIWELSCTAEKTLNLAQCLIYLFIHLFIQSFTHSFIQLLIASDMSCDLHGQLQGQPSELIKEMISVDTVVYINLSCEWISWISFSPNFEVLKPNSRLYPKMILLKAS